MMVHLQKATYDQRENKDVKHDVLHEKHGELNDNSSQSLILFTRLRIEPLLREEM